MKKFSGYLYTLCGVGTTDIFTRYYFILAYIASADRSVRKAFIQERREINDEKCMYGI